MQKNEYKHTIEELKNYAKEHNGECLSNRYMGCHHKYKFRCKLHGIFRMKAKQAFYFGNWCKKCGYIARSNKIRDTLQKYQDIVNKRDGEILSKKYIDSTTYLKIRCKKHNSIFIQVPSSLTRGHWGCRKCVSSRFSEMNKLSIEDAQKDANKIGLICLSKIYVTSRIKLKYKCKKCNKTYETMPCTVRRGRGCPFCCEVQNSKREKEVRLFLESIFGKYPRQKYSWLQNKNGNWLQLDGYNALINHAFEINGIQHYKSVDFFGGKKQLKKTIRNDVKKLKICKEKGIVLSVIPYFIDDWREYLLKDMHENHLINMAERRENNINTVI